MPVIYIYTVIKDPVTGKPAKGEYVTHYVNFDPNDPKQIAALNHSIGVAEELESMDPRNKGK